jgi:hypothetical protein
MGLDITVHLYTLPYKFPITRLSEKKYKGLTLDGGQAYDLSSD